MINTIFTLTVFQLHNNAQFRRHVFGHIITRTYMFFASNLRLEAVMESIFLPQKPRQMSTYLHLVSHIPDHDLAPTSLRQWCLYSQIYRIHRKMYSMKRSVVPSSIQYVSPHELFITYKTILCSSLIYL